LALRYATKLHEQRAGLPAKLVLTLTVTAPLRAMVALVLSTFISS
jgi:hypothetical protein